MRRRVYIRHAYEITVALNKRNAFRDPADVSNGYPLSKYLSSFARHKLSYTSLEVACHAIESYCDKLKAGNYEDLIVKCHSIKAA